MSKNRSPRRPDRALWLRVVAELGAAPVTEAYISTKKQDEYIDGLCEGGDVIINPAHQTVDTVIHELLHRIYPQRSERSIRRSVTMLRQSLSDDEVQAFYAEYLRRRRKGQPRSADL